MQDYSTISRPMLSLLSDVPLPFGPCSTSGEGKDAILFIGIVATYAVFSRRGYLGDQTWELGEVIIGGI